MKKLFSALLLSFTLVAFNGCKKDVSTTSPKPVPVIVPPPVDTTLQISVYPNPSSGTFTIQTNDNNAHTIEIVDLIGQIKFKEVVGGEITIIDFLSLQAGIYSITVTGKGKTLVKKIIIQ